MLLHGYAWIGWVAALEIEGSRRLKMTLYVLVSCHSIVSFEILRSGNMIPLISILSGLVNVFGAGSWATFWQNMSRSQYEACSESNAQGKITSIRIRLESGLFQDCFRPSQR